jgi:Domain of unknown function (DUF4136)
MRRSTRLFALIPVLALAAAAVSACATMNVSAHKQRGLDFARYHTYDWGPADALPTGDPRLDHDPFFKDHLEGAVEKQLALRGFERPSTGTPDLLIHYHASVNTRIDVDRSERQYGYCFDENCGARVYEYEAGTLILDFVDTTTNKVVWRGWAQDAVQGMLENKDVMAKKINEAVTGMLEQLPKGL